jgi:8-oxo-dGTP pyrophosphatase MutT (NUDIX family)
MPEQNPALPHDPAPWQVLERRYVLDRQPYMTLREDTVRLPGGAVIPDYFIFEYPDWVMTLAVTAQGEFVLIRQYRHGIAAVHFELAAGVADPGSSPLENAQRELLEETGYGGGNWQPWLQASANPATHTNTSHIFLARGVERRGEQRLESTEDISVQLLSAADTLQMLRQGGVFQALHAAALWRYFAEFGLPQLD